MKIKSLLFALGFALSLPAHAIFVQGASQFDVPGRAPELDPAGIATNLGGTTATLY